MYRRLSIIFFFSFVVHQVSMAQNDKIVLMLDCSSSMKEKMPELKSSVYRFIELTPLNCNEISIYTFGFETHTPFSSDAAYLNNHVRQLKADRFTYLYRCLDKVYKDNRGSSIKAICLFSDGIPTDKPNDYSLKVRQDIPIYSIGFNLDEDAKKVLESLSSQSGGETKYSSNINQLKQVFGEMSVRISSGSIHANIYPDNQLANIPRSRDGEISGYYFFQRADLYINSTGKDNLDRQKDAIVYYLKQNGYPNALYINDSGIKLLTIDEESNKSEWLNGTIRKKGNSIYLEYTYNYTFYQIKLDVLHITGNSIVLKLVTFIEDEDWGLVEDGNWRYSDKATLLAIHFVKDNCR